MWRVGTRAMLAMVMLSGAITAQADPKLIHDRDVDIKYRVSKPDEPAFDRRVRWQASSQLERMDGPGNAVVIIDHRTHFETLLQNERHSYLKIAVPLGINLLDPDPDIPKTSKGHDSVAGLSCTEWGWIDGDQKAHSLCVTEGGVLLREEADGRNLLTAKSVRYRKINPSTFAVPDNFVPALAPDGPPG
jgi:hypothetical protein